MFVNSVVSFMVLIVNNGKIGLRCRGGVKRKGVRKEEVVVGDRNRVRGEGGV